MRVLLLPALAGALLLLVGCPSSIKVDLSDMLYVNPDADSLREDQTDDREDAGDMAGDWVELDDIEPEAGPDVIGPEDLYCWDIVVCLMQEGCNSLTDDACYDKCAKGDAWMQVQAITDFKACIAKKCGTGSGYTLPGDTEACLKEQCGKEFLQCIRRPEGDQGCWQVMQCMDEGGCMDTAKEDINCFAGCASHAGPEAVYDLEALFTACPADDQEIQDLPVEDQKTCVKGMYLCMGGSGDKTCGDVLECSRLCENQYGKQDSPEKDQCQSDCLNGVSKEGAELLYGSVVCLYDPMMNPFDCLLDTWECREGVEGQGLPCDGGLSTASALYYPYYNKLTPDMLDLLGLETAEAVTWQHKYSLMLWSVQATKTEDLDSLHKLLSCLNDKQKGAAIPQGAKDAYGIIGEFQWLKCEKDSTCEHGVWNAPGGNN